MYIAINSVRNNDWREIRSDPQQKFRTNKINYKRTK